MENQDRKEYLKKWHKKNRKRLNKYAKQWRRKNIKKYRAYKKSYYLKTKGLSNRKYYLSHPWMMCLNSIKGRCSRSYYKKNKIKNFLTSKDIKFLWFRDKAFQMKRPSISRNKHNKNYTLNNCKFMELKKHLELDRKIKTMQHYMPNGKFKKILKKKRGCHVGIKNPKYKKNITINEIRNLFKKGIPIGKIAKQFGVSGTLISNRLKGI